MQHLRACHEFAQIALEYLEEPDQRDFVVFLVENYSYFVMTSNLRASPQEDNVLRGFELTSSMLPLVKEYPSFGSMFAFEPESFTLIPQIAELFGNGVDAQHRTTTYTALLGMISHEQSECTSELLKCSFLDTRQLVIAIKINTLLMFLHASLYEDDLTSVSMMELLQPLVDHTMMLLTHVEETEACYGLFWSILVTGSYIQDRDKQVLLVRQLETNQSRMSLMRKGVDLLQWLWKDEHNSFGLTGLERVAARRGVEVCIC